MVPRLINFIEASRKVKLPIIYVRTIHICENNWSLSDVFLEQQRRVGKAKYFDCAPLEEGSWGAEFYKGIKPLSGEAVITKHRYDGFWGTNLELLLKSKRIRTIIATGVSTNCCVEATVKSGFMRDYYMVVPKDCVSTTTLEKQENTLKSIDFFIGQVTTSSDIINCWQK